VSKAQRVRWIFLIAALAMTLSAIVFPVESPDQAEVVASVNPMRPPSPFTERSIERDFAAPSQEALPEIDPFGPRGWQAPPPTQPIVIATSSTPVEQPGPAPAPPLPFKFMGRMQDSGEEVVYLSQGDQMHVVRTGTLIGSSYKVTTIHPHHLEFEYLPTGEKQTLSLPAAEN